MSGNSSSRNKVDFANLLLNFIQVRQNSNLNKSMKQLLITSNTSLTELENISDTQGLIFEEIKKQSDLLTKKERKEQYKDAIIDVAFEMIKENERVKNFKTNLEKHLVAIQYIQVYGFLRNEIKNISSLDEKLQVANALDCLFEYAELKSITLSEAEYVVLDEMFSLDEQRKKIQRIRDIGRKYTKEFERIQKMDERSVITELKIPVENKLSRPTYLKVFLIYFFSFPLLLVNATIGVIFFLVGTLILILSILGGITGSIIKDMDKENLRNSEKIRMKIESFRLDCEERCNKQLKKKENQTGEIINFDNYAIYTRTQNTKITKEYKKILKSYPSLTMKPSNA